MDTGRPIVEVVVEGELSLFEHEALYKLPSSVGRSKATVGSNL
jgi:hypothetical protein